MYLPSEIWQEILLRTTNSINIGHLSRINKAIHKITTSKFFWMVYYSKRDIYQINKSLEALVANNQELVLPAYEAVKENHWKHKSKAEKDNSRKSTSKNDPYHVLPTVHSLLLFYSIMRKSSSIESLRENFDLETNKRIMYLPDFDSMAIIKDVTRLMDYIKNPWPIWDIQRFGISIDAIYRISDMFYINYRHLITAVFSRFKGSIVKPPLLRYKRFADYTIIYYCNLGNIKMVYKILKLLSTLKIYDNNRKNELGMILYIFLPSDKYNKCYNSSKQIFKDIFPLSHDLWVSEYADRFE